MGRTLCQPPHEHLATLEKVVKLAKPSHVHKYLLLRSEYLSKLVVPQEYSDLGQPKFFDSLSLYLTF